MCSFTHIWFPVPNYIDILYRGGEQASGKVSVWRATWSVESLAAEVQLH